MSGATAMTVLAGAAAAGTAYSVYAGEKASKAQGQAVARQEQAAQEAKQAATVQADMADQATNAANKKRPNVGAMLSGNKTGAAGGGASTMLTGPGGVDMANLNLGKNTLLGQ